MRTLLAHHLLAIYSLTHKRHTRFYICYEDHPGDARGSMGGLGVGQTVYTEILNLDFNLQRVLTAHTEPTDLNRRLTMPRVISSALDNVEHINGNLIVTFDKGGNKVRKYHNVPSHVYNALLTTASAGAYFNTQIRGKYTESIVSTSN